MAANQNHSEALFYLGLIYDKAEFVPRDINKAIDCYSKSSDLNNSKAQLNLGLLYINETNIRDVNKAINYLELSAYQNNTDAQLNLGLIYNEGKFVPQNVNEAIYFFMLAANQKHPEAQFQLGRIYYDRKIDQRKAIRYIELAANNNHPNAQFSLGLHYYKTSNNNQIIIKGADLILRASENGFKPAIFSAAFLNHEGKCITQNINKAVNLYKESSTYENIFAKNNLGVLYKNGFFDVLEKISRIQKFISTKQSKKMTNWQNIICHIIIYTINKHQMSQPKK